MIDIIPWAGDNPYIVLNVNNMKIRMSAPKQRSFWIYFNVQAKERDDLAEVAKAAKWSFVIDTGVEQLSCSNTVSYDVRKTLDHAILVYRHKDSQNVRWEIPITTRDAVSLSAELKQKFSKFDTVRYKDNAVFKTYHTILRNTGELYKFRFPLPKTK